MNKHSNIQIMNRYLFQIGDEVVHMEVPEIKGTIIELLTFNNDEKVYDLNPSDPMYHIMWDDPKGEWKGFEHQSILLPIYYSINKGIIRL